MTSGAEQTRCPLAATFLTTAPATASTRQGLLVQAWVLAVIALLGTLPFWLTDLDLRVAAHFYHPQADDPWFEGGLPLWSFLYRGAPVLMGLLVLGALVGLAAGSLWGRWRHLRLPALVVLASALLGPGLLINGLLKEHWDRPRPHQVEDLGGAKAYLPPLLPGESAGGKSFPCGHSSVGYLLGVFYLVWRRRRPRLALGALVGSLALGTLLGVGRMASGDHFLSDVIWSGIITYGVALALYQGALWLPRREAAPAPQPLFVPASPGHRILLGLGLGLFGLVTLTGVLLATPVSDSGRGVIPLEEHQPDPRVLRIEADQADLVLYGMGGPGRGLVRFQARGFGLPSARVDQGSEVRDGVLTYRIVHQGVFTERDTRLALGLVANQWDRIEARIGSGNIRVHPMGPTSPLLDLESADGVVVVE